MATDKTTIKLSVSVRDRLEDVRKRQDLDSLSDALSWLLDQDDLRPRVARLEKQIAYLLEQVGGADEDDQISE